MALPDGSKLPFSLITKPQNISDGRVSLMGDALELSLDRHRRVLDELLPATGQPEDRPPRHQQQGYYDNHRQDHDQLKKGEHPTSAAP